MHPWAKAALVLGACAGGEAFAPAMMPGLQLRARAGPGGAPAAVRGARLVAGARVARLPPLRMGLFDAFKNALANEDLGTPPPDGLSQDPWLSGMRKAIVVKFVKDGEVVAEGEALPGDKVADVARKAKVTLPATCMMKANGQDVQVSAATSRVPAPERRQLGDRRGGLGDDGLGLPCPPRPSSPEPPPVRVAHAAGAVLLACFAGESCGPLLICLVLCVYRVCLRLCGPTFRSAARCARLL